MNKPPPPTSPAKVFTYELDPKFPKACTPKIGKYYRVGCDLAVPETIVMKSNETRKIDLGIRIDIPDEYFAILTGRSCLPHRYDAYVVTGIIDPVYCSNLFVTLHAFRDTEIPQGEYICQLVMRKHDITPIFLKKTKPIKLSTPLPGQS